MAQNTKPVALLPQVRSFQTSPPTRDIDSAAKFIGAGAATVGVAGSGEEVVREFARLIVNVKNNVIVPMDWLGLSDGLTYSGNPLPVLYAEYSVERSEAILHQGLTYGHLVAPLLPREGLRKGEKTSQQDARVIKRWGDKKPLTCTLPVCIEIFHRQPFEFNVRAGQETVKPFDSVQCPELNSD